MFVGYLEHAPPISLILGRGLLLNLYLSPVFGIIFNSYVFMLKILSRFTQVSFQGVIAQYVEVVITQSWESLFSFICLLQIKISSDEINFSDF